MPSSSIFDPTVLAPVFVEPVDATDPIHPEISWTVGAGSTGKAVALSFGPEIPFAVSPHFLVYAPSGFGSAFRLPDVPAAMPHFALDGPEGPPIGWHGSVTYLDDENATSWSEFYLFQGLPVGPYGFITSSGSG